MRSTVDREVEIMPGIVGCAVGSEAGRIRFTVDLETEIRRPRCTFDPEAEILLGVS